MHFMMGVRPYAPLLVNCNAKTIYYTPWGTVGTYHTLQCLAIERCLVGRDVIIWKRVKGEIALLIWKSGDPE